MATQSWSTRIRHDSDATFREWGSELGVKLALVGLIQTADTGQINWVTVARPGANTEAGYEIWRFDDALQSTAPIFLRIGYGTGGTTTTPRIQVTVGTSSNGSGTIGGTALSTARTINSAGGATTDTARQSYLSHVNGMLALNWKTGATSVGTFILTRTCDSTGAETDTGAIAIWAGDKQAFRFAATAAAYTAITTAASGAICLNVLSPSSTAVGADIQASLCFTITPRMEPLVQICGVVPSEVTPGSTFSAIMIGSTPRTYLAFTSDNAQPTPISTGTGHMAFAVLWE